MSDVIEKSLEDIFNGITIQSKLWSESSPSKREINDAVELVRKDLAAAVNSYSRSGIQEEKLTKRGKSNMDRSFRSWVLYNASLERGYFDDRNAATYCFSMDQAEYYRDSDPREDAFMYRLSKAVYEDMHPTLQQNLMRVLCHYYSERGKAVAHAFPFI